MELAALSGGAHGASRTFERWFPTPKILAPHSVGVDISDASIKWLALSPLPSGHGYRVHLYGTRPLAEGIVVGGMVRDPQALGLALYGLKKEFSGINCAHVALPEEAAYVFSMFVPEGTPRDQILRLIEFEFEGRVPIPPSASVYDFDVISTHSAEGMEIGVAVFPKEIAESYVSAFDTARMELLSLEIEARSIARAVSGSSAQEPVTLLVDFGMARTGFALLKRGVPIFTSTVEVGGAAMTRAAIDKMSLTPDEADKFKNDEGLLSKRKDAAPVIEAMTGAATALADEVARHFHYWDTRRDQRGERVTPVERVILVGGSSNLQGLAEFVSAKVHAPVESGNIWRNICSFDEYVPPIDHRTSLQYATAAGLALRGI